MPAIRLAELHPILVHFPIALLLTSVALDCASIALKRWGLAEAATWCLVIGVPFAAAAILAGQVSEGQINIDAVGAAAAQTLHSHKLFAAGAGLLFGVLLIVRLVWLSPRIMAAVAQSVPRMKSAMIGMQRSLHTILPGIYADRPPKLIMGLYLILSLGAVALLAITGYLGGELVYTYHAIPR